MRCAGNTCVVTRLIFRSKLFKEIPFSLSRYYRFTACLGLCLLCTGSLSSPALGIKRYDNQLEQGTQILNNYPVERERMMSSVIATWAQSLSSFDNNSDFRIYQLQLLSQEEVIFLPFMGKLFQAISRNGQELVHYAKRIFERSTRAKAATTFQAIEREHPSPRHVSLSYNILSLVNNKGQ